VPRRMARLAWKAGLVAVVRSERRTKSRPSKRPAVRITFPGGARRLGGAGGDAAIGRVCFGGLVVVFELLGPGKDWIGWGGRFTVGVDVTDRRKRFGFRVAKKGL
jgi:hypothetical protein